MTAQNKSIAVLFPGQGSQHVGMASDFMAHPATQHLFVEANDILHFDITALMRDGDENTLRQTENAQPALLLAGIAAYTYWQQEHGLQPTVFAGHSVGEYTALVAAGVLGFADGLKLVRDRGLLMKDAMPEGTGGMSAVLGLSIDVLEPIAEQFGIFVANDNTDGQVILSGEKDKLEQAAPALKEAGAKRVLPLPVAGAFHTPLMQSAADKISELLVDMPFNTPTAPIILNTTAIPTMDAVLMKDELPKQLVAPVRWRETMQQLNALNIEQAYEFGAGAVLTNLLKRSGFGIEATVVNAC